MTAEKNIPALRFKGFTEAWEQRKLGEIVEVNSGRDYKHLNPGNIPVYGTGGYMLSVDEALSYKEDAIGIGRKGTIDNPYKLIAPFWTVDTLFYALSKAKKDIDFILCLFQKIDWKSKDESTGVPSLSKQTINNVEVFVPRSSSEMAEIGNVFSKISTLITLHQRKLDLYKNTKKSLLEKMFPKDGEDRPSFRFKGFTEAWEQRKLEQEVIFSKGSGYSKADLSTEGLPLILYGRLYTNYESEITNVDTFAAQKTGTVFSSGNEVIVPASGETAEDIARASAVKVKGCMLGGDLNILVLKINIDSTFLAISISNGDVSKKLACMAQGKSVVHIHNSDIEQLEIPFPSLTEQVRIVGVFRHIDTLITLHQRKLELLKNMKKALLEKMFV